MGNGEVAYCVFLGVCYTDALRLAGVDSTRLGPSPTTHLFAHVNFSNQFFEKRIQKDSHFLRPAQYSLQFLYLDLDYNNNNFICTKRLSVVQFGCLLDVRRPRGAALDQKGTEMDDALNFIIL